MTCIKITESQNGKIYPEDTISHGAAHIYFFSNSFTYDLHVCEFYYQLPWLHHNPLFTGYLYKGTLGNCADPDQMGHNEVSDQGLNCYLRNFYL